MQPSDWALLAHPTGPPTDAPIPLSYAIVGGLVALYASFDVMRTRGRLPAGDDRAAGRPVSRAMVVLVDSQLARLLQRLVGLIAVAVALVVAIIGPSENNPTAGLVYAIFWAGLVPASLLLGPVWRRLNPLRALHTLAATALRRPDGTGFAELPRWVGYWPAALSLLSFVWLELVWPSGDRPITLVVWFGLYGLLHLVAAVIYGRGWFDQADGFEVLSALVGRLARLGRRSDGTLVTRSPLLSLERATTEPGMLAVVCVLLGSTMYDSLSSQQWWVQAVPAEGSMAVVVGTLGLLAVVTLVAAGLVLATRLGVGKGWHSGRLLPAHFAHSVIPVAAGYHVAHYFSLLLNDGQGAVVLAASTLATGGIGPTIATSQSVNAAVIWILQVIAIVAGHVVGVVVAHRRAVLVLPPQRAITGQVPLLVLMMAFTVTGLLLLYQD